MYGLALREEEGHWGHLTGTKGSGTISYSRHIIRPKRFSPFVKITDLQSTKTKGGGLSFSLYEIRTEKKKRLGRKKIQLYFPPPLISNAMKNISPIFPGNRSMYITDISPMSLKGIRDLNPCEKNCCGVEAKVNQRRRFQDAL